VNADSLFRFLLKHRLPVVDTIGGGYEKGVVLNDKTLTTGWNTHKVVKDLGGYFLYRRADRDNWKMLTVVNSAEEVVEELSRRMA